MCMIVRGVALLMLLRECFSCKLLRECSLMARLHVLVPRCWPHANGIGLYNAPQSANRIARRMPCASARRSSLSTCSLTNLLTITLIPIVIRIRSRRAAHRAGTRMAHSCWRVLLEHVGQPVPCAWQLRTSPQNCPLRTCLADAHGPLCKRM